MSRSATVYVCSEDATEVVGTADVVECYLDNEEDPAIILRGVMFDAERVLSSQVHVLQHDVEYYKQARDAECLKSPDRVPGWTITASGFDEAVESCITEDATVPPHKFAERLGVVCVPDPEPTSAEKLAGRTITESELIAAVDETNHEDMNEYQKARALLVHLGHTVPDPGLTNFERLEALLEGGDINAQWGLRGGGVMFARELARALDEAGVKAPGGDDE